MEKLLVFFDCAIEVAVDAAMHEDEQGQLARLLLRKESVGAQNHRVAGTLRGGVLDDARRRAGVAHHVHHGQVLQAALDHHLVELAGQRLLGEVERLLQVLQPFRDVGRISGFFAGDDLRAACSRRNDADYAACARQRKRYWPANTRTARVTKESAWNATSCFQSRRNRTDDPVVPSSRVLDQGCASGCP